ncbi:hypothetical protein HX021_00875 [Sphingobacterium sp. N143]|uniref:hypothetical protein n=1 Tax=Sphingobacterium sp. N143 TaxID=2746727 RepID=UPI0025779A0E|nr:hypothetical protein [Sphingobacterium sp. N143]MDM1292845.1 hypothetical protein [Sphingobacterium sp. N143]
MANQTISKAFGILFTYPIWRIEVDAENSLIAIETRNPDDTFPYFNVITFGGDFIVQDFKGISKEWILAGIQCQKLILKKISDSSPIDAGVHVIDCYDPEKQETWFNYLFLNLVDKGLLLRPKMIEQGLELFLNLSTMTMGDKKTAAIKPYESKIVYPVIYKGEIPHFLTDFIIHDDLWINALNDYFIWAFYEKNKDNHYQIRIVRSTKDTMLDSLVAVSQLQLKFFNIHFLVNKQIFLLTDNKREFVSYLV